MKLRSRQRRLRSNATGNTKSRRKHWPFTQDGFAATGAGSQSNGTGTAVPAFSQWPDRLRQWRRPIAKMAMLLTKAGATQNAPLSGAKSRLPAPFELLNLHTDRRSCVCVGDLIPLRTQKTSPGTKPAGAYLLFASGKQNPYFNFRIELRVRSAAPGPP